MQRWKGCCVAQDARQQPKSTIAVVPDVAAPSAFDGAIKDVHGIVHVASNMSFNNDPAKAIPGVKRATLSVLETAA